MLIHRDIKPDNFAIGFDKPNTVYILDYGLTKYYKDPLYNTHIQFSDNKRLTGTMRYASINNHLGYDQSRRDDLESLGYTLIYLMKGNLPWQGIKGDTKKERQSKIMTSKMDISINNLCKELPEDMVSYMYYCRGLNFEDKPDYENLRKQFLNYVSSKKLNIGFQFDWLKPEITIKRSSTLNPSTKFKNGNETLNKLKSKLRKESVIEQFDLKNKRIEEIKRKDSVCVSNKKSENLYSIMNDTNYAERDPMEDNKSNDSCNFKENDIEEECIFINIIDNVIPVEKPINTIIRVPLFVCQKKNYQWKIINMKKFKTEIELLKKVVKRTKTAFG